mmetsp:Transcript_7678/g.14498  ORF Transcript_7678/g.14498 Transcript_7678/m.14498 type:complete len:249 (+) Transcript_7678:293-1039(+)
MIATSTHSSYYDSQDSSLASSEEQPESKEEKLKALRTILDNANSMKEKGNLHYAAKEYKQAMDLYVSSLESVPYGEFAGYFREELNSLKLKCFTNIIRCCLALNNLQVAVETSKAGLVEFPTSVPLMYLCASACEKLGEYTEALKMLKEAYQYEPSNQQLVASIKRVIALKKEAEEKEKALFRGKLLPKAKQIQSPPVTQAPLEPVEKSDQGAEDVHESNGGWGWLAGFTLLAAAGAVGMYLMKSKLS